jgi:hypothetical protein
MTTVGFHHLIQSLGKAARMPFPLHPWTWCRAWSKERAGSPGIFGAMDDDGRRAGSRG